MFLETERMNLIITFSGRIGGNCDKIANHIASGSDKIVHFRELNVYPCSNCGYECFSGTCKFRSDDIYSLYSEMLHFERVILLVPMYGGNPSSLYFIFNERGQDYFSHNDTYGEIVKRLYIIGIYGSAEHSPDFIPVLEKWFVGTSLQNRVLGIERHRYGQKLNDSIIDVHEVMEKIERFLES